MNDLEIRNSFFSQKMKWMVVLCGVYLTAISMAVSIMQALQNNFSIFFIAGIIGIIIGVTLILSVTLWLPKPIIVINNEFFHIHLPKQKVDGSLDWDNVTQIGIGLSYLTMATNDQKNYKINLENLRYTDLKAIKSKLIEICEAKNIPYKNV